MNTRSMCELATADIEVVIREGINNTKDATIVSHAKNVLILAERVGRLECALKSIAVLGECNNTEKAVAVAKGCLGFDLNVQDIALLKGGCE